MVKKAQKGLETLSCIFFTQDEISISCDTCKPNVFSNCLDNWQRPATESVAKSSDPRESNQFPEKTMKISNKCNINFTEKNISISQIYP